MNEDNGLAARVHAVVDATPILDMHTHLFAPEFGELNLWGIDELLTYHYLVAEFFRESTLGYEEFWRLSKQQQADAIWQKLFVENTPVSDATCGVIAVLTALGLDPRASLRNLRDWFGKQDAGEHITRIMKLAGVTDIVMTNDPFDPTEAPLWLRGPARDPRFHAVLRLDPMLNQWPATCPILAERGYSVDAQFGGRTTAELRRFLDEWSDRMNPIYMAVSLPDDFSYPAGDARNRLITEVVLPACRDLDIPFALMVGVRRQINPALRLAGDGVGCADVRCVERLCEDFPDNRFLSTFLARENQHALCVAARKFRNLMPFGCWWFVNNPSIITEITRERFEMLGTSFIPQHSDARVFDQIIYKWRHSRRIIAECLTESYRQLEYSGLAVSDEEMRRDVEKLFAGNFRTWIGNRIPANAGRQSA